MVSRGYKVDLLSQKGLQVEPGDETVNPPNHLND